VGAAEESAKMPWSGESPNNRKCSSTELFLPNGQANTGMFTEQPKPKSRRKDIPIEYKICPQQRTYDRIEELEQQLEKDLETGAVSPESYNEHRDLLDRKKERAWVLLCKAKGWEVEEEQEIEQQTEQEETQTFRYKNIKWDGAPELLRISIILVVVIGTIHWLITP
tara:strand:+ start:82932 stop:83432 length:501 start_codon:yes stop_codon:yes gene_type:complete